MRSLAEIPVQPVLPCVIWTKGLIGLAPSPEMLHGVLRSFYETWPERSQERWYLLDSQGRCFNIAGWERIKPFGGCLKSLVKRLLDGIVFVFAAPVLTNERQLTLNEFKRTMRYAAAWRYFYYKDQGTRSELDVIREKVRTATSYLEVIQALPLDI